MMSNPPSALQQRQKLHRRQNSTPIAFEAMKVPNLPPTTTTASDRPNSHRRGQSFDQRIPRRRLQQQQPGGMVSITNIGSIQPGQQILRETQRQRTARPGQQHIEIPASPQCGIYSPNMHSGPMTPYENVTTMNAIMQVSGNMQFAHSPYFVPDLSMPMSAGFDGMGLNLDENNQHYFQHLHSMNQQQMAMNMMHERSMSQPDVRVQTDLRSLTPTQQMHSAHFPLTPATTPFNNTTQLAYSRSLQSSPVRYHGDETIRAPHPISMQRGRSLRGIVESEETQHIAPSPPSTAPLYQRNNFELAELPIPEEFSSQPEPTKINSEIQHYASSHASPASLGSPGGSIFEDEANESLPFFDETGGQGALLKDQPVPVLPSSEGSARNASPNRPALSPRRMSISDLNLEPGINASIEETNITLDDIAQFIDGPDPIDNKWVCNFENCNKKFGRKENIKSHVQTHLGDRQFRCDHCKKCFVRGHDLKRHAKIHTGTKPYPCLCGNSFARHDALTRHRQRGMCIGAFDGVVKKVIKRGRPRKHRPEMEDRLDKASKTRMKAIESNYHYESSASSCSHSSWGSPPTETMESLSIRGNSPFDDVTLFARTPTHMEGHSFGLPPDMFSFTPPTSPQYSCGNHPSPSHRSVSPTEVADMPELPRHSNSLMVNTMSMVPHSHQSLPSLSHSSSSPAADIVAFDFSEDPLAHVQRLAMKMESERNDFDNFLDYGTMEMNMDGGNGDSFFAM